MLIQSLIAAVFLLRSARATPTGNHTCTGVVKHEVTVRVNVTEPVTFRAYEWCLRVPPRCSTYTIQLRDRVKIHKEMHNRTITVCCKGYVEIDYKCVPACPPETECPNMHCNRTNHCYCTPGYTGLYCNHPCPKGVWGAGCIKPCDCPPGYTCHHLTGDCMIDDSPPPKTRRTTTAEYLTEAATTLDTTQPTTRTPTTLQIGQPTTTPTTTTTTTTTPTTTTTTTTTERPTTTTTTTTTTERPTTTELVTQPPTPTQPTTTTTVSPTTTEQITTTTTSTAAPAIRKTFEGATIPITRTTTEAVTTHQATDKTREMTPPTIHEETTEATEGTTTKITSTKTATQITKIKMTSTTTTTLPPSTTIAFITAPLTALEEKTMEATIPTTVEEKTVEVTIPISTSTTTTTTATTPGTTPDQTTRTTIKTEPTTSPTPNTTPTAPTTQETVQSTQTTTQLPTTTTIETLPTTIQREIQTEPTIFVAPPIKFDLAAITTQAPVSTDRTIQTLHLPTTVAHTTTTSEQTSQPTTSTTTTSTERQTQGEPITSTTLKIALQTAPAPGEEVSRMLTTATPQLEQKKLDIWGAKQNRMETKTDEKESFQSVVKIGLTEQQFVSSAKPELEFEKSRREPILEKQGVHRDEKLLENVGQAPTSTTDRLDRMIIEDVPKPVQPKPTTDDSPIKLVEEVIAKYFPDTVLKPNKAQTSDKDKSLGKWKEEMSEKSSTTPWMTETKDETTIKAKTVETTEVVGTEEETKSHPRTDITTTTMPPPTTPDISTMPIITPKVIVSAKNPDEIDLGGVIYRKMKFFPPAKQPEEPNVQATPPPTASSMNLYSPTLREPTTPNEDRFKIYLPEYEKSTEKINSETTDSPTVRTFLPKFNFDKEDFDYGKQYQPKKAKQKDKEIKKYKIKPNEATVPPTLAEEVENERVTNNVFLETKEFKVHLETTKAAKFGDGYYTKSDQESTDFANKKKKPKYGLPEYEPTKSVKYTVPPESQDFEEGTREGNFPTTNAKPPHTWYSHAREKAKIKNAFKIMKSTIGLDLSAKPTEETALEESNDIHSMATQFTEREPRSAAVTYQEDLNNPQMFGQVKFNAREGFLSSIADEGVKSGIYASVAVGGGCFVAMATLVAVLWLRLKGRARPRESSVSFEDGDVRNPVRTGLPGRASNAIGDYETVYPISSESHEMEVATFFCPTFTNNYAERINREFKEMSYDHPRSSFPEPLYAEVLHPKIKDVADQLEK